MCGEDGTQRRVYKLKEEHEERGSGEKKRSVKDINKKEENKRRKKELYCSLKKTIVVPILDI